MKTWFTLVHVFDSTGPREIVEAQVDDQANKSMWRMSRR